LFLKLYFQMKKKRDKNTRLTQEVNSKYNAYFQAHRKAMRNKANTDLQKDKEVKRLEWLEAVKAMKEGQINN
jgi:hypothetical protein